MSSGNRQRHVDGVKGLADLTDQGRGNSGRQRTVHLSDDTVITFQMEDVPEMDRHMAASGGRRVPDMTGEPCYGKKVLQVTYRRCDGK